MSMNWVLICVIGILAISAYTGWKKGVIRIVVSLLSLVATILLTIVLSPSIETLLKENTSVYDTLESKIYSSIIKDEQINNATNQVIGSEAEMASQYDENSEQIASYIDEITEAINLPENVAVQIKQAVSDVNDLSLNSSMNTVKDQVLIELATRFTAFIYSVIVHIVVFIIVLILLRILLVVTDVVGRLPIIRQANHIGGCIAGVLEGLFIVWSLFTIVSLAGRTGFGASIIANINDNSFLSWINNNNIIIKSIF